VTVGLTTLSLLASTVAAFALGSPDRAAAANAPILGASRATVADARAWSREHQATPRFTSLASLYWRGAANRGVRPEVAYAQAAKETAFGRFGGVIDASFHNPCGLKRARGGGNYDPGAHQRFPSWRAGVNAHLDHLALYAGARGYPRAETRDSRHFPYLLGRARSIQALGGAWAPSRAYGQSIVTLVSSFAGPRPVGSSPPPRRTAMDERSEGRDWGWRSFFPFVDALLDRTPLVDQGSISRLEKA
jgi:hypothetical protein